MTERTLFNLYDVCSTKSIRMQRYETAADKGILRLGRQGSPTDRIRRLASTAEPGFPRQSRRRIDRELFASRKQQHGAQPERTADPARLSEPGLRPDRWRSRTGRVLLLQISRTGGSTDRTERRRRPAKHPAAALALCCVSQEAHDNDPQYDCQQDHAKGKRFPGLF